MEKRDEWVRVKSESELRVGMCVELRTCKWCDRRERFFLADMADNRTGQFRMPYGSIHESISAHKWRTAGRCESARQWTVFSDKNIPEGRLYRLSDSQLTDSDTTQELERVR